MIRIVTGVQRSGTSLIMQMLQAGGHKVLAEGPPPDRYNPRGYFEDWRMDGLARGETDWLDEAGGKAIKIFVPHLFHLPMDRRYRAVLCLRDPETILRSQARYAWDYTPEETQKLDPLPESVTDLIREGEQFLRKQGIPFMKIQYESVLQAPEAEASRLAAFFGGTVRPMAAQVRPELSHFTSPE